MSSHFIIALTNTFYFWTRFDFHCSKGEERGAYFHLSIPGIMSRTHHPHCSCAAFLALCGFSGRVHHTGCPCSADPGTCPGFLGHAKQQVLPWPQRLVGPSPHLDDLLREGDLGPEFCAWG